MNGEMAFTITMTGEKASVIADWWFRSNVEKLNQKKWKFERINGIWYRWQKKAVKMFTGNLGT